MRIRRTPVFVSTFLGLVVGAVLFIYSMGLEGGADADKVLVVVASQPINKGQILKRSMITMRAVPKRYAPSNVVLDSDLTRFLGAKAMDDVEVDHFLMKYNFQR